MQIILCRHGETEWTKLGKHTSYTDIDLTENGILQAKNLQEKLQNVSFDQVLSSPRIRAQNTCKFALPNKNYKIEELAVEWNYGDYEALTTKEIWQTRPDWNLFKDGVPGGESPEMIGNRAKTLIQKLLDQNQNTVLFSHGHFLRVLAAVWLDLPPQCAKLFGLSVSSVSILGFERHQKIIQQWNCI